MDRWLLLFSHGCKAVDQRRCITRGNIVFIGLLSRIDKKSYFDEKFERSAFTKKALWIWNAGAILLLGSFVEGVPGQ